MKTADQTLVKNVDETNEFLDYLVTKGGPGNKQDYDQFISLVNNLQPSEINEFRKDISFALNENTLMGHGFIKPFGYAGDFLLIDKIYQHTVNPNPLYSNWDIFFQNQPGAHAVRNRKNYFVDICRRLISEKKNAKVLILGSGPATDVFEFLSGKYGRKDIKFDLVDFDQAAIDYSMKKNHVFNDQISYYRINALRFNCLKQYDLIWTAGLFDYFKDKHFSYLIRKYFNLLTEDGQMIVGNFSTRNPSKNLMENVIDWVLNLRTESDLYRIAADANIDKELVSIDREQLGINLFLIIRKNIMPLN